MKTRISKPFETSLFTFLFVFSFIVTGYTQNVGIGTTNPDEKLTVVGTIKSNIDSDNNFPHIHIHEADQDYGRIKFSNVSSSQYFTLAGNPQRDSTLARFNIVNSDFGNVASFTGHGRFGINALNPAATFHLNAQPGADLMRIQNDNNTKFRILSNNAIVFGTKWDQALPNVIRMETPNLFIGFDDGHIPEHRFEVDGTILSSRNSNSTNPHLELHETEYDYTRLKFTNSSTSSYFNLAGRPADDPSLARFNLFNSNFGNIITATGQGRLGVNKVPQAAFHSNAVSGTDPMIIENDGDIKFSIKSNNAISIGSEWDPGIANVVRIETPNMFIGFDKNHVPKERLEVDGAVKIGSGSATPTDGSIQYNPNAEEFQVYTDNRWNTLGYKKDKIEIGDDIYGGRVFWLDESGEHGLVVSLANLGNYKWGTENCCYFDSDGDGIYAGKLNTYLIIENTSGSSLTSAAKACQDYSGGGYGDWYLPSKTEMSRLFSNLVTPGLLTLSANTRYWTSNEEIQITDVRAYTYWNTGTPSIQIKSSLNNVRAIRAF